MTEHPEHQTKAAASNVYVRDIVRNVILNVAPDELPLVDGLSLLTDHEVLEQLNRRGRDDMVGFGGDEVLVMIAPALWIALDQALRNVIDNSIDNVRRRKPLKRLKNRILRGRRAAPTAVPDLDREQISQIRAEMRLVLGRDGVSAERAEAVAELVEVLLTREVPKIDKTASPPEDDDPRKPGDGTAPDK